MKYLRFLKLKKSSKGKCLLQVYGKKWTIYVRREGLLLNGNCSWVFVTFVKLIDNFSNGFTKTGQKRVEKYLERSVIYNDSLLVVTVEILKGQRGGAVTGLLFSPPLHIHYTMRVTP